MTMGTDDPGALVALVDRDRLAAFMGSVAPVDGPLDIDVLSGGRSNVTYVVRTGDYEYVVRRRPVGPVARGAHDMAREYRVLAALKDAPVAVPEVFGFCDDESVVGAPFYVMARVGGVVLHGPDDVATIASATATQLCDRVVDELASLHEVEPAAVGLADLGRPQDFVARRIDRWMTQWQHGAHRDFPMVEQLGRRFAAVVPADPDAALIHGDYRLGNMLVTVDDPPRVAALLDWEMSTLGDPLTDLAHLLVYWEPTCGRITHESQRIAAHPGFRSGAELAQRYAATTGRGIDALRFYLAFEHWRAAIIKEGIVQRHLASPDGGAADQEELAASVAVHLDEAADLMTGSEA
jgi:aminoglycoside phosphotransferase (APT) family kinase protein